MSATLKLTYKAIGAEVRRGTYDVVLDGERVERHSNLRRRRWRDRRLPMHRKEILAAGYVRAGSDAKTERSRRTLGHHSTTRFLLARCSASLCRSAEDRGMESGPAGKAARSQG
jgi:hypothetical protein